MKNVNKVLTYAVMLDSLIVTYIQFRIILIELKKVLSQKLNICVARLPSYLNEPYQKLWLLPSYTVIALEINNYIVQIRIMLYRNVHILYIQYIYTPQIHMPISGIVVHCTG